MEAQNIFTIETLNSEQTNALLAFVKTLKVPDFTSTDRLS